MSFKEGQDKIDLNRAREFNALTRIPEEMSVGELNQAVRDLREMLYQGRRMKCPNCSTVLVKQKDDGEHVKRCPNCKSGWFIVCCREPK